jgi:hypothetical protein
MSRIVQLIEKFDSIYSIITDAEEILDEDINTCDISGEIENDLLGILDELRRITGRAINALKADEK